MTVAVLALLTALTGCQAKYVVCDAWSGGENDYAVYGKVSAAGSAMALPDARVNFTSSEGLADHDFTDQNGCYHRELRVTNADGAPHRWDIEVNLAGYEVYRADLGIHPAGDSVRRDVSLQPS